MTLVIAEAGVNHNGNKNLAFKLIDAAHKAGADIVKFQTFKADNLVTKKAEQADYQISNSKDAETQWDMLSKLELSHDDHFELLDYSKKLGIEFLSTAFDSESLKFLVEELGLKRLKIPSGEVTNAPFLLEHARTGCDLIVSSGCTNLAELESALGVIAFGLTASKTSQPNDSLFSEAYSSDEGQKALKNKVTLLHCTTEYPAPYSEINLRAIETLANTFKLPVGFSDHSAGIAMPFASIPFGVCIIEKHFTLDKTLEGPDHKASLDPLELTEMINGIRQIEIAMGDGLKKPTISELKNRSIIRKSLVAQQVIKSGDVFTAENIAIKRPGDGISPYKYWNYLGKLALKEYLPGDIIDEQ
ncbi:N-acetylneuraminate synthase [Gammaproteobacteria bacterium]|nr:N-acetylneuraminate synthase [Gammaproteobacteria bacterium]MDC0090013.1 N-acetylneuraminate synthase [Gammaproteobacteria bacterium]